MGSLSDLISRLVSLELQGHGVEETLATVLPILRSRSTTTRTFLTRQVS